MDALHLFGPVAAADIAGPGPAEVVGCYGLEDIVLFPSVEFRDGGGMADSAGEQAAQLHQAVGFRVRQRLYQGLD